jgi:hypothetical protein
MATKLFTDDNVESFKSRLSSIIEVANEDDLRTHFRQTILFKDEGRVSGVIASNTFKIWTHEQGGSGVTGIFYPIITGQIRPLPQGLEIELNSKLNSIGKAVLIFVWIILTYWIVTGIVIQENNELKYLMSRSLIGMILLALMLSVPIYIYKRTSRIVKRYLTKELGLRNAR